MKKIYTGVLVCLLATALTSSAGVFTNLHNFVSGSTGDGSAPNGVLLYNGLLYGATAQGGANGNGMIFTLGTNGTGFNSIHDFGATPDGSWPNELLEVGDVLFGTTYLGGTNGSGSIYRMNINGSSYVELRSFTNNPDPQFSQTGLIIGGATLYGVSTSGGANGLGCVFKVDTNGANFADLHDFANNTDGSKPMGRLLLNGATLYGTTTEGGTNTDGTIFKLNTNGGNYSILYQFSNAPAATAPNVGLAINGNTLYGVSTAGGTEDSGTVFSLGTNGTGFTIIHNFTNNEGISPQAQLVIRNTTLYGSTLSRVSGASGTIFQLGLDGSNFSVLKNFTNAVTGANPKGQLALGGNTLYGIANAVGPNNGGTVFGLILSPVILSQPQNLTVTNGNSATLTVVATDDNNISYQWYFNNSLLGGQTGASINFANAVTNNSGTYTVVASDATGSVTSSPAILTVVGAPAITGQPQSLTVANGSPATFNVTAVGGGLTYQWYFNTNTLLGGQTGTSLTIPAVNPGSAGAYTVVVANNIGSVTSSPAILTVASPKPGIGTQPQSRSVTNGYATTFTVAATNGPLNYQWYFNTTTALAGQTNSAFTIPAVLTNNAGSYTVVVSNNTGAVTSTPAVLTVIVTPVIILGQPQNLLVSYNATTNFTVGAYGQGTLVYKWYSNSTPTQVFNAAALLSTGTSPNLNVTALFTNVSYYYVLVTNSLGRATSSPSAMLTVVTAPLITSNPQPATVFAGDVANFSVGALGATLHYQWYSNSVNTAIGTPVAGQTGATYSFATTANSNGRYFSVVVTNTFGKATSGPPALLTVSSPPSISITLQPLSVTITNGSSVTFTSAAAGSGPLSYQWLYQTNIVIPGATNTSLTFATANLAGAYSMLVTNSTGAVTSSPAILTVIGRPIILTSSFNQGSGSYSFNFVNLAGSVNRLQATTNLVNPNAWVGVATNIMVTNGTWQVTDPNAAQLYPIRLYRFVSP